MLPTTAALLVMRREEENQAVMVGIAAATAVAAAAAVGEFHQNWRKPAVGPVLGLGVANTGLNCSTSGHYWPLLSDFWPLHF